MSAGLSEQTNKTSEAQKKASSKYIRDKVEQVTIHLRKENELEMEFYQFLGKERIKAKILALYEFWRDSEDE